MGNSGARYYELGHENYRSNIETAKKCYLKAIDCGYVDAYRALGMLYHSQQEYDLAKKYYILYIEKEKEKENTPDFAYKKFRTIMTLAGMYLKENNLEETKKYIMMCADLEPYSDSLNPYSNMYLHSVMFKDFEEAYYIKASEKGNIIAMRHLANLYNKNDKPDLAEKYYLMAYYNNNNNNKEEQVASLSELCDLYIDQLKLDLAEKYLIILNKTEPLQEFYNNKPKLEAAKQYLLEIEKENVYAMIELANFYSDKRKFKLALKYMLMAFNHDKTNNEVLGNLGTIYVFMKDYDNAIKYFNLAIDNGFPKAYSAICMVYIEKYDKQLAEKYFLKAYFHNEFDEVLFEHMRILYKNTMEFYNFLTKIEKPNEYIIKCMNQYKSENKQIRHFQNKLHMLSKEGECPICYEERKLIPRECTHWFCQDCYAYNTKCPMCGD